MSAAIAAASPKVSGEFRTPRCLAAALLAHGDMRRARGWHPARAGPLLVLFAGHLDNAGAAATRLGMPTPAPGDTQTLAALYGTALLSWGERADTELIGEYAAIALDEESESLRLARSPLRAPPLHYYSDAERVIASTSHHAIFAAGVERRLDEAKLANMAVFNASDEARGWFEGVSRVPLGSTIAIGPQHQSARRYYDIAALPRLPRASRNELVEQARSLFGEATRAALAGSQRPAIMLSGGLDSSLIAVSALEALPQAEQLNTYTNVVEPDWKRYEYAGRITDERPLVEAFCAMHPRIVPHYLDNAQDGFDSRLAELFLTTGGAPQGLANVASYHALWDAARKDGCDRVILGEFGNITASADGSWAFSEYLVRMRWPQLVAALRGASGDGRSMARRFLALAVLPFLPDRLWHEQRRLRGVDNLYHLATPLRDDYARQSGAFERSRLAGFPNLRFPLRDRFAAMREVHDTAWGEFSDVYAGFSEIHGLDQRDPYAYRPFFEFCAGLPSDMFLHLGQNRWLARELLRGKMPEAARLEARTAVHNADWHAKLGRQREGLRRELDAMAKVPRLATIFDFDRIRAELEDWPESGAVPERRRFVLDGALSRAVIMARFVNYVEGRNLEL